VRPRATRNVEARLVNLTFGIDEGQRAYIERINVRGNTRTRDYVLRREFDLVEGDAYNRALVNRAERRLKNLAYFKSVKITAEPGSAPDRVILNVDVEETSTGEFSVSGGYSTADGFLAEVSVAERNLLGRGFYGKTALQYGQYTRGVQLSFVDPYFLGYRVALGLDLFAKQQNSTSYVSYTTKTLGFGGRFGFTLREDLGLQVRYSLYRQEISLPNQLQNCNNINPDWITTFPTADKYGTPGFVFPGGANQINQNCYQDGEASLAVKKELAQGPVITSLVGYTITYNALDNNKSPTNGILADLKQDFAGVGGDVNFIRTASDVYAYREVLPDVVGLLHLQGGLITGWGGRDLRMLDHFQMGPSLVRGFAPAGIGPRDLTQYPFTGVLGDALGGSMYWGASFEVQTPVYWLPKDAGVKVAAFADAGSLWNYTGPTTFPATGEVLSGNFCSTWGPGTVGVPCAVDNAMHIRSSVGVGLIWDSPFGPLRFDYSFPLSKQPYDRVQQFRFGGGTRF
jgi:outer membrane protein insertion porin family